MPKYIIDVFMYVFEWLLFFYYTNTLFRRKRQTAVTIIASFVGYIVLFAAYQFNITYLNAIFIILVNSLLIKLLFDVGYKTAVFHSIIFLVVMFGTEILVMSLSNLLFGSFNAFENEIIAYLFVISSSKVLYLLVMVLLLNLFAQKEDREQRSKIFWLLFLVPLSSILMLTAFRYITYLVELPSEMSLLWMVACLLTLFSNILVFFIYEYSVKSTKELEQLKALRIREEQDKKYFEVIEQSNHEMRVFSHNIRNHLTQIRNLDDIQEVRSYVDGLYPDLDTFSRIGISKNPMLDLIISKYTALCEKHHIRFDVDVKTANLSYMENTDLSTLLNNLLDNAMESAVQSKVKWIELKIFSRNQQYDGLILSNSCDEEPTEKNGKLLTSKKDKSEHGLGIAAVKKIVKKYNAIYDWNYNERKNAFLTTIAFKKA